MSHPGGSATPSATRGRPRLLILTPDFPPRHGGIQTLVHRLAQAMTGFQIELVTLQAQGARRFDSQEALVTRRVGGRFGRRRVQMLALNARALGRALRFRPALTLSAHIVVSPAAAAIRLLGVRTVQYFHANEIARKPRLAAFAVAHADVGIAVSAYTASLVRATGALSANLQVIPPGVDLPGESAKVPAERPTVLTIAQLIYAYKGHDVLARALGRVRVAVPDVEWVIVGDGPLRSSLEDLVASYGLAESARFLGAVSDEERNHWLRRADVFAMPSRLPGEGFGIAYLEANAHGMPVVAANVGGPVDAVADGMSGLLVDPTDSAAVADAVIRLLLDHELARRLGRNGAERAREFAWPIIAGRVESTLLELAELRR